MNQPEIASGLELELDRIAAIASPEDRAYAATQLIDVLQTSVMRVAEIRSDSFRSLRTDGWSLGQISRVFGITRARVAQLTADKLEAPSRDGQTPD